MRLYITTAGKTVTGTRRLRDNPIPNPIPNSIPNPIPATSLGLSPAVNAVIFLCALKSEKTLKGNLVHRDFENGSLTADCQMGQRGR